MSIKTKKTRTERTCHLCKSTIMKGELYGRKNISLGKSASWTRDDRPTEEIPAYAWQPYRVSVAVCSECAMQ
mgnify:CR=1 FL=1|tara:strand:+ start:1056 stop:1271 length:216 start_codon:yes stop_codon:yes gene_type:complete